MNDWWWTEPAAWSDGSCRAAMVSRLSSRLCLRCPRRYRRERWSGRDRSRLGRDGTWRNSRWKDRHRTWCGRPDAGAAGDRKIEDQLEAPTGTIVTTTDADLARRSDEGMHDAHHGTSACRDEEHEDVLPVNRENYAEGQTPGHSADRVRKSTPSLVNRRDRRAGKHGESDAPDAGTDERPSSWRFWTG